MGGKNWKLACLAALVFAAALGAAAWGNGERGEAASLAAASVQDHATSPSGVAVSDAAHQDAGDLAPPREGPRRPASPFIRVCIEAAVYYLRTTGDHAGFQALVFACILQALGRV